MYDLAARASVKQAMVERRRGAPRAAGRRGALSATGRPDQAGPKRKREDEAHGSEADEALSLSQLGG